MDAVWVYIGYGLQGLKSNATGEIVAQVRRDSTKTDCYLVGGRLFYGENNAKEFAKNEYLSRAKIAGK